MRKIRFLATYFLTVLWKMFINGFQRLKLTISQEERYSYKEERYSHKRRVNAVV